jgi:hypothetical protein
MQVLSHSGGRVAARASIAMLADDGPPCSDEGPRVMRFSPRQFISLIGTAIAVTLSAGFAAGPASAGSTPSAAQIQAQRVGTDAYVYGISLMEFVRQARQQTSVTVPNSFSDAPLNQFGNARNLNNAQHQVFVQPNNDTLYTMGHLDLGAGPIVLHVPNVSGGRYYSIQLLDPYTNDFAYVGTRATGDRAGNYVVTGPGFHGRLPPGVKRIRSDYRRVWLVGRTLVNGPSDLPAVHKVQNGYKLIPLKDYERFGLSWTPPRPRKIITTHTNPVVPTGIAYFNALGDALAQNPPPARDAALLRELATVGIGPGKRPSHENLSPDVIAGLTAAANGGTKAIAGIRAGFAAKAIATHHGWYVAAPDIGAYGVDYNLRAVVAIYGLGANRPIEAMYPVGAADTTGTLLDGSHRYVLHFNAGKLPPARYFWSLTMYNQAFYLIANPINRYAIGNRTAGVKYNPDGSLDVYLQATPPPGHQSNWLPSPASGEFEVTLRLYGPRQSALNDTYQYPSITKVG